MEKFSYYFGFLGVVAALAIFVACGTGEIVDLAEGSREYTELLGPQGSLGNLTANGAFIDDCSRDADYELCQQLKETPAVISSSSSLISPEISSSSASDSGPSSSSVATNQSSSGTVVAPSSSSAAIITQSSSSIATAQSSSAGCTGSACAPIPAFTCTWAPATVVSGDEATININITGADDGCTKKAYVEFPINNQMGINPCFAKTVVSNDGPVITSGQISGSCDYNGQIRNGSWTWPTNGAVTAVKGEVTCGIGASQNSEAKTCAINITTPPKPTKSGSISFSNADYTSASSRYFYIGSTPEVANTVVVTNNGASPDPKCESTGTTVKLEGNTTAAGAIKAVAVVVCRGNEHRLDSATATVVADPTVSGSCSWNTKGNTFGGGVSAKVTAAPTITNVYGRTCEGPYFTVGSTQKETVAAGLTVDAWNGTATQTMSSIAISATCAGKTLNSITCPNITVKDPDAMCEYTPSICGGVALTQIKTAAQSGTINDTDRCYYATTITSMGNVSGSFTVNGSEIGKCGNTGWGQPACATALAGVELLDGGYYIYTPDNYKGDFVTANSHAPLLHPNCEAQK